MWEESDSKDSTEESVSTRVSTKVDSYRNEREVGV